MNICVVGTGYVGLVAGTCLADLGHHIVCCDRDEAKIAKLLDGGLPIYEPGLSHLVQRNVREGRLKFTTDTVTAVQRCPVAYIAVGTPPAEDGSADLSGVFAVATLLGQAMTQPTTIVIKSTVPVGTADRVRELVGANARHAFDIVSNPEFLKEGNAIEDFLKPDRIVVGCKEDRTREVMNNLYEPLVRTGKPILFMDNRSAELTKYTSNAFLAMRISFINEIAMLCERLGADVDAVRRGAGSDSRIGMRFFFPGVGYGGSCFPKDVQALMSTAEDHGYPLSILQAVEDVNARQKAVLADKITRRFGGDLAGMTVAVWGLSFKPETDDMREAPALVVIEDLLAKGVHIRVYDPEAMQEARKVLGDRVHWASSPLDAASGAKALLLVTEWNEFRKPNWSDIKGAMADNPLVLDGRNIWSPTRMRAAGFEYQCIGRPRA
jgi:UDPglucose 6-dehydrogenase